MMSGRLRAWSLSVVVLVIVVAMGVAVSLWRNLSSEWSVEAISAQYALDHSPVNHIDFHSVFTGSGAEEVFSGSDMFGQRWYAFVSENPLSVHYVSDNHVVSVKRVLRATQQLSVVPRAVTLGYLDDTARTALRTNAPVVWEVTGHKGRDPVYLYYDASTGRFIQSFTVKP